MFIPLQELTTSSTGYVGSKSEYSPAAESTVMFATGTRHLFMACGCDTLKPFTVWRTMLALDRQLKLPTGHKILVMSSFCKSREGC